MIDWTLHEMLDNVRKEHNYCLNYYPWLHDHSYHKPLKAYAAAVTAAADTRSRFIEMEGNCDTTEPDMVSVWSTKEERALNDLLNYYFCKRKEKSDTTDWMSIWRDKVEREARELLDTRKHTGQRNIKCDIVSALRDMEKRREAWELIMLKKLNCEVIEVDNTTGKFIQSDESQVTEDNCEIIQSENKTVENCMQMSWNQSENESKREKNFDVIDSGKTTENPIRDIVQTNECKIQNITGIEFEDGKDAEILVKLVPHTANQRKPFVCETCGRRFRNKVFFYSHQIMHTKPTKLYVCKVCGKNFKSLCLIQNHQKLCHTMKKPYLCHICEKAFRTRSQCVQHMSIHSGTESSFKFMCEKCGKGFRLKTSLKVHYATHSDAKPFVCEICEKSFRFQSSLKEHYLTHADTKPFICEVCGQTFTSKSLMRKHQNRRHSGKKLYRCEQCGRGCSELHILKDHMNVHLGITPYKCDICERVYSSKRGLYRHKKRVHSKEKTSISFLRKHQDRRHSGKKLYHCKQCGRGCSELHILKDHMNIHLGITPYKCDICERVYSSKRGLYCHKKRVHPKEKTVCE